MPTRIHPGNTGSVTVGDREIAFKRGEPFEVTDDEAAALDAEGFTNPEPKSRKKSAEPTNPEGSEPVTQEPTP